MSLEELKRIKWHAVDTRKYEILSENHRDDFNEYQQNTKEDNEKKARDREDFHIGPYVRPDSPIEVYSPLPSP